MNNTWETSIFYLKELPKGNSEHKIFEKIERIYGGRVTNAITAKTSSLEMCSFETTVVQCDGSCAREGYSQCDGFACPTGQCIRTSVTYMSCTGGSGGGDGSSDPGGYPSGGGSDTDPYSYYPNNYDNPVFDDPNYINALKRQYFWEDLDYGNQLWAVNNQESYNKLIQYLIQNNWSDKSKIFANEIIDTSRLLELNAMEVWNDYDNFVGQMSISEKAIFENLLPNRKLWYMVSAKKAFDKANDFFPNSTYNGIGDAFRHALWNGLCALTLGSNLGEQLTTAHENKPSQYTFNYKETEMDLYNNEKGRQIAISSNLTNITDNILQDLNNGYLRYLNNLNQSTDPQFNNRATYNSILIPTNQ